MLLLLLLLVVIVMLGSRLIFIRTLIFLPTILCSTILKPDLDLSLSETDFACNVRLLLGRDVRVGDVLLFQLALLSLVVHCPVFLACSRLPCKLQQWFTLKFTLSPSITRMLYRKFNLCNFYFAPVGVRSIAISDLCVCLFVCLFVCQLASQKPEVRILPTFLYMLPVTVARPSSGGHAIRFVLLIMWITSCFSHNGANGTESKTTHSSSSSTCEGTASASCCRKEKTELLYKWTSRNFRQYTNSFS